MKFFFCEVLNLVNIVGQVSMLHINFNVFYLIFMLKTSNSLQIYFMDFFLGGEFTTYGTDVIAMTQMPPEEREDPMARVFPKMTKCTFHKFGPSGTVEVRLTKAERNPYNLTCKYKSGYFC